MIILICIFVSELLRSVHRFSCTAVHMALCCCDMAQKTIWKETKLLENDRNKIKLNVRFLPAVHSLTVLSSSEIRGAKMVERAHSVSKHIYVRIDLIVPHGKHMLNMTKFHNRWPLFLQSHALNGPNAISHHEWKMWTWIIWCDQSMRQHPSKWHSLKTYWNDFVKKIPCFLLDSQMYLYHSKIVYCRKTESCMLARYHHYPLKINKYWSRRPNSIGHKVYAQLLALSLSLYVSHSWSWHILLAFNQIIKYINQSINRYIAVKNSNWKIEEKFISRFEWKYYSFHTCCP